MEKLNIIATALIMLLTMQGCRNSGQHTGQNAQVPEAETTSAVTDEAALIDTIDQYVNTIRESGHV